MDSANIKDVSEQDIYVFLSRGGLDGKWLAVTNDGKLEEDWKDPEKRKSLKKLGGIMRTLSLIHI